MRDRRNILICKGALCLKKKSSGINYAKPADTMITCTLMHCMQAGQAGRQVWARSQQTTKRMDAWTAGRPAVREYLGARRIHACMLFSEGERAPGLLLPTISSSSRTEMKCRVRPLHFISVTLPLLLGCRCVMQGNLLLLTDKVVWYSTQHSTVQYVRVLTLQPWAGRGRN